MTGRALARRLEQLLDASGEPGRRIVRLRRRRSRSRSSHRLDEVIVDFADGTRRDFVLKGFGASAERSRSVVRPGFVTDPYRELWAYERLLGRVGVRTPRALGTLGEPGGRDRLVLERSPGTTLREIGEIGAWESAACWLGSFHAEGLLLTSDLTGSGHLLVQDASFHRRWLGRARRMSRERGRRRDAAELESLTPAYERAVSLLAAEPRTIVHGEFYASNIVVEREDETWHVCPIDWESVALGPAAIDLAALGSGDWGREARLRLGEAHARAMAPAAAPGPSALAAAELVLAVQWLGWSSRWNPPSEHAHDWLAAAREAAERLGA